VRKSKALGQLAHAGDGAGIGHEAKWTWHGGILRYRPALFRRILA
jgi:hypothetical protein